jgi:hypothetical protein
MIATTIRISIKVKPNLGLASLDLEAHNLIPEEPVLCLIGPPLISVTKPYKNALNWGNHHIINTF